MEQLTHIGNARREERVLLPALIELRSERGEDTLHADGLDVSASGLSMRAAFVPEVGTRLHCSFRCPPHDDAVSALGEVVWSSWDGPRSGSFGMRFLELDTKSATAIRRLVEPDLLTAQEPPAPEPARVAVMRIDGLAAPIEADVRLLESDCVVLEQELSFLRLGRGIEVDVPGRGKERGRIASIELRQGPLDTPTLVFGVLLDELRQPEHAEQPSLARAEIDEIAQPVRLPHPKSAAGTLDEPFVEKPRELAPEAKVAARVAVQERTESREQPSVAPHAEARVGRSEAPRVAASPGVAAPAFAQAATQPAAPAAAQLDEDELEQQLLRRRGPDVLAFVRTTLATLFTLLRTQVWPGLRSAMARVRGQLPELRGEQSPVARALLLLARLRALFGALWSKVARRRAEAKRRTTAPTPRIQQVSKPSRTQQRAKVAAPPKNRRLLTATLALVGVGLGVYALAPRSGADRIRVGKRELVSAPSEAERARGPSEATAAPALSAPASIGSGAAEAQAAQVESLASAAQEPVPSAAVRPRFGEVEVPNGRSFVLRMSGPVQSIEGESREDGFTVRIPGRLALDRASPIATSHRAVARALILNRGEYAELTVEFLPGMRPKYQVAGKDNTIEVTLERL